MTSTQIRDIFTYHKPFGNQSSRYQDIRTTAAALALMIYDYCPESREKSLAFTNLQQTVMWANAAIAINEKEPSTAESNS